MSKSIPLSPKYGVNPTIPCCAWCGQPKNEIALMGRMSRKKTVRNAWGGQSTVIEDNDMEAPKNIILDYEPCDDCREKWSMGVVVLEATTRRPEPYRPPIQKSGEDEIYPTMRYVVIKPTAAERVFNGEFHCGSKLLLEDTAFEQMFGEALRND